MVHTYSFGPISKFCLHRLTEISCLPSSRLREAIAFEESWWLSKILRVKTGSGRQVNRGVTAEKPDREATRRSRESGKIIQRFLTSGKLSPGGRLRKSKAGVKRRKSCREAILAPTLTCLNRQSYQRKKGIYNSPPLIISISFLLPREEKFCGRIFRDGLKRISRGFPHYVEIRWMVRQKK